MNQSASLNAYAKHPTSVSIGQIFGTSANAAQGNSFDVGTLENKDFYGGFMSPLDLESLNLLLNAGLNKELVLHSVIEAFRVRLAGRSLLFVNNPEDDVPYNGAPCVSLYDGTEHAFEPVSQRGVWRDPVACKYQKFLYFLRVAVRWGVTVEAAAGGQAGEAPARASPPGRATRARRCSISCATIRPSRRRTACPAVPMRRAPADRRTATSAQTRELQFRFQFNSPIEGVAPVVRSPYAVFQYYGHLLANIKHERVQLSELSRRKDPRREARLLTIETGGVDCFADTVYAGTRYCVPNEKSKNTKEIFVLLNTLVAISTNRSALPVSPTFVLTP